MRISLECDSSNGWKSLLDLGKDASSSHIDEHSLLEDARKDDANRIHSILSTSGTSAGRPKGCPQRVGSITHILNSQSWLINPGNCALVLQQAHNSRAIAPQHTLQVWKGGGAVVMASKSFAIEDTVNAIVQHGVDFIVLSPAMVHELARDLAAHPGKLDSVRTIQVGGDAITKEVLMKCAALFPRARVCINHGMTEGGGFFRWPFFETPIPQIPFFGEICPIGTVAAGTMLRIWDADRGRPTRRGEPGELHVCCESVIRHYLGGVSESSFYEDKKGRWFNTGDVGMINDEGLVFILGRSKDVIKRAGVVIMPAALESCIEKYTGAQVSIVYPLRAYPMSFVLCIDQRPALLTMYTLYKTSVVAVPHPVLGHEPFAVLSTINDKNETDIKEYVCRMLGPDYALGGLSSLKQIGFQEFPVNATHKIIKFEVQMAVEQHLKKIDRVGLTIS